MKSKISLAFFSAALLAACGDTVENVYQTGMEVYSSEDDLPKCTDDNEGDQAYLKDEDAMRICVDGKWKSMDAAAAEFSCKMVELKDKSGSKIVCNGDSIGVVLNGSDGADGKNGENGKNGEDGVSGTGCSITDRNDTAVVVTCGDSTMTISLGVGQSGDSLEDLDREPISLDSLAGYTQKGPFLKGSTVYLYELSDGRTLKQTNGNFTSSISSDDGRYKFSARDLVSQYAMVVVDGYYRNEVTGATSDATIRLKALTDMRKRSSVNVNLLTHMEFDRVYNLVTKEQKSVKKAKQQAQEEILNLFHIKLDNKTDAEDMDVFGKSDADAALLAISVILQGDRSEADLASLLAAFAADLADNGLWDNLRDRAQIADWAMKKTFSAEGLAAIRANVEGWGLGDGKAPAFEGLVTNFWETELKVGVCSKDNEGAIKSIGNKYSTYFAQKDSVASEGDSSDVRLICAADGGSYAWRYAADIEKNIAAITNVSEGLAKYGAVNTQNVYVYEDGWRRGTDLDMTLNLSCIASRAGKIVKSVTTWYTCDTVPTAWREATTAEADTAGFGIPTGDDPIVRVGNVDDQKTYVYEDEKWRQGTDLDRLGDLGACTLGKVNKVVHLSTAKQDEDWYKCDSYKVVVGNEIQVSSAWREATDFEADTAGIGAKATEIRGDNDITGVILKGNLTSEDLNYYIYESGKWRRADTLEVDTYDHTNNVAWAPAATDAVIRQGFVTNQNYVYDSLEGGWRLSTSSLDLDSDLGACTSKRSQSLFYYNAMANSNVPGEIIQKIVGNDTLGYVCLNNLWRRASTARVDMRYMRCNRDNRGALEGFRFANDFTAVSFDDGWTGEFYVCDADTFRALSESEKWAALARGENYKVADNIRCGPADEGKSVKIKKLGTRYVCRDGFYEWDGVPVYYDNALMDSAGNNYPVVNIGTQVWMASNLRVDIEGSYAPDGIEPETINVYEDSVKAYADSIKVYGRLYKYEDAVNACEHAIASTSGFHLPTREEWEILLDHESGEYYAGKSYKSKDTWGKYGGDDKYLFGAVETGNKYTYNYTSATYPVEYNKGGTNFWGFDEVTYGGMTGIYTLYLSRDNQMYVSVAEKIDENQKYRSYYSVRCIADSDIPLPPKNPNK